MNAFEVLIEHADDPLLHVDLMTFMVDHGWFPSRPWERPDHYEGTTLLSAERFKAFLESEIREALNEIVVVTVQRL